MEMSLLRGRPGCFMLHVVLVGRRTCQGGRGLGRGWTRRLPIYHTGTDGGQNLPDLIILSTRRRRGGGGAQLRARYVWSVAAGHIRRSSKCQTF